MVQVWQLLAGMGLDIAFGDPRCLPHPVRAIGSWAGSMERLWRAARLPSRLSGVGFWLSVVVPVTLLVWLTQPWANIYWIWMFLALRSLDADSAAVVEALRAGRVEAARRALAMIVGRDTESLNEREIIRAVLETVSENLNDAVIAPLFYLVLFGPAGMAAYKAINTLDSIAGYKNNAYLEFGWASARMDDAASFVPARLSAALVWICAGILRMNAQRSVRVTLRDARLQPSPNSGYSEAAFAGALGVRLGGVNYYGGVAAPKAYLGDDLRPLAVDIFSDARLLLYGASGLMLVLVCGVALWK
jgi:adenosylcobinamide-phosphate synthase